MTQARRVGPRGPEGAVATAASCRSGLRCSRLEAGFGLVEMLVAVVILGFGLLAVAGMTLGVAQQTQGSAVRSDQAMAAQQVIEHMIGEPYGTFPAGVAVDDTTISVRGHPYEVSRAVYEASARVDSLRVIVAGKGVVGPDTFRARLYEPKPPPTAP